MPDINSIGVLILAAGGSSRLGRPKQLIEIESKPLINHIVQVVLDSDLQTVVVVCGAYSEKIIRSLDGLPVEICLNPDWASGMSTSLRAGILHLETRHPQVKMVLIMLADQPFVSAVLINSILNMNQHSGKEIIASEYEDTIGVPALFPKSYFRELKSIEGDKGARKLLIKYASRVGSVSFEAGRIDIDTPDDAEYLQKRMEGNEEDLHDFD